MQPRAGRRVPLAALETATDRCARPGELPAPAARAAEMRDLRNFRHREPLDLKDFTMWRANGPKWKRDVIVPAGLGFQQIRNFRDRCRDLVSFEGNTRTDCFGRVAQFRAGAFSQTSLALAFTAAFGRHSDRHRPACHYAFAYC